MPETLTEPETKAATAGAEDRCARCGHPRSVHYDRLETFCCYRDCDCEGFEEPK